MHMLCTICIQLQYILKQVDGLHSRLFCAEMCGRGAGQKICLVNAWPNINDMQLKLKGAIVCFNELINNQQSLTGSYMYMKVFLGHFVVVHLLARQQRHEINYDWFSFRTIIDCFR